MTGNKRTRKTIPFSEDTNEGDAIKEVEPTVEKEGKVDIAEIPDVSETPFAENPIERIGNDDFLFKDTESAVESTNPVENTLNNFNVTSEDTLKNNSSSPNEFSIDDPSAGLSNGGGTDSANPSQEVNQIPKEVSDGASDGLADMILGVYGMIVPEVAQSYSKINVTQITELEKKGKISTGLTEVVKDINKKNKGAVQFTSAQQKLIKDPLVKVLEVRGVKASPEGMLLIAVVTVVGMHFLQAKSIKDDNAEYIERWMKDHSEAGKLRQELEEMKRKEQERIQSSKIEYAETEEV